MVSLVFRVIKTKQEVTMSTRTKGEDLALDFLCECLDSHANGRNEFDVTAKEITILRPVGTTVYWNNKRTDGKFVQKVIFEGRSFICVTDEIIG